MCTEIHVHHGTTLQEKTRFLEEMKENLLVGKRMAIGVRLLNVEYYTGQRLA